MSQVDNVFSRDRELKEEITEEYNKLFRERYGKRSEATLSTMELDRLVQQAGENVMKRKRQARGRRI